MRSPAELRFRLRQELANLHLYLAPPKWAKPLTGPLPGLPTVVPDDLAYRKEIVQLADELLQHRFRLLGLDPVTLKPPIRWRRDFVHGQETGLEYFRCIPYLDFARAGDHKIIWELNRHQHLVVLAQAFVLTGQRQFLDEIPLQLDHWIAENPMNRGMNWTSALEVAFRALSWLLVLHLVGRNLTEDFRRRWMRSLYHHGLHLEYNLSFYFSPNTHLLGEAVVLGAMGVLLPEMPHAERWRDISTKTVHEQMRTQVREDGSHFEQSSYYHVYALEFFALHASLHADTPAWYRAKLGKMAAFRDALVSSEGTLPLIGDEDGGSLFHPYGDRRRFGARRPEELAWWGIDLTQQSPVKSQLFPDAGIAVMRSDRAHVIVDVGPFGRGSAGHSHADTLAIVAFVDGEELLIDAGTFTYISDPEARQRFRGTAAHNTVFIDGLEQAEPSGPFRWVDPPSVELLHWSSDAVRDIVDAQCSYRGFTHRRTVTLQKPDVLIVEDRIAGPPGKHTLEQRWLTPANVSLEIESEPAASVEPAERSAAFGSREPAQRWVARYLGTLPATIIAKIGLGAPRQAR
jgi:hypothetical protein